MGVLLGWSWQMPKQRSARRSTLLAGGVMTSSGRHWKMVGCQVGGGVAGKADARRPALMRMMRPIDLVEGSLAWMDPKRKTQSCRLVGR